MSDADAAKSRLADAIAEAVTATFTSEQDTAAYLQWQATADFAQISLDMFYQLGGRLLVGIWHQSDTSPDSTYTPPSFKMMRLAAGPGEGGSSVAKLVSTFRFTTYLVFECTAGPDGVVLDPSRPPLQQVEVMVINLRRTTSSAPGPPIKRRHSPQMAPAVLPPLPKQIPPSDVTHNANDQPPPDDMAVDTTGHDGQPSSDAATVTRKRITPQFVGPLPVSTSSLQLAPDKPQPDASLPAQLPPGAAPITSQPERIQSTPQHTPKPQRAEAELTLQKHDPDFLLRQFVRKRNEAYKRFVRLLDQRRAQVVQHLVANDPTAWVPEAVAQVEEAMTVLGWSRTFQWLSSDELGTPESTKSLTTRPKSFVLGGPDGESDNPDDDDDVLTAWGESDDEARFAGYTEEELAELYEESDDQTPLPATGLTRPPQEYEAILTHLRGLESETPDAELDKPQENLVDLEALMYEDRAVGPGTLAADHDAAVDADWARLERQVKQRRARPGHLVGTPLAQLHVKILLNEYITQRMEYWNDKHEAKYESTLVRDWPIIRKFHDKYQTKLDDLTKRVLPKFCLGIVDAQPVSEAEVRRLASSLDMTVFSIREHEHALSLMESNWVPKAIKAPLRRSRGLKSAPLPGSVSEGSPRRSPRLQNKSKSGSQSQDPAATMVVDVSDHSEPDADVSDAASEDSMDGFIVSDDDDDNLEEELQTEAGDSDAESEREQKSDGDAMAVDQDGSEPAPSKETIRPSSPVKVSHIIVNVPVLRSPAKDIAPTQNAASQNQDSGSDMDLDPPAPPAAIETNNAAIAHDRTPSTSNDAPGTALDQAPVPRAPIATKQNKPLLKFMQSRVNALAARVLTTDPAPPPAPPLAPPEVTAAQKQLIGQMQSVVNRYTSAELAEEMRAFTKRLATGKKSSSSGPAFFALGILHHLGAADASGNNTNNNNNKLLPQPSAATWQDTVNRFELVKAKEHEQAVRRRKFGSQVVGSESESDDLGPSKRRKTGVHNNYESDVSDDANMHSDPMEDVPQMAKQRKKSRWRARRRQSLSQSPEPAMSKFSVFKPSEMAKAQELSARIDERASQQQHKMKDGVVINPGYDASQQAICIPSYLAGSLQPHQMEGVRHIWKLSMMMGRGCILAHAMGLGKTLQALTVVATVFTELAKGSTGLPPHLKTRRVVVVAPKTVAPNWAAELMYWIPHAKRREIGLSHYLLDEYPTMAERLKVVRKWHSKGGVLIASYPMLRSCATPSWRAARRDKAGEVVGTVAGDAVPKDADGDVSMAQPHDEDTEAFKSMVIGDADMLILDEAHILKNDKSQLARLFSLVRTPTRIAMTGTPLQNSLREYWVMADLVAPNFLGEEEEFKAKCIVPIMNGQHADSSINDKRVSEYTMTMLTEYLAEFVHRRDTSVLHNRLPPKFEVVLYCNITRLQLELMEGLCQECLGGHRRNDLFSMSKLVTYILNHPVVFKRRIKAMNDQLKGKTVTGPVQSDPEEENEVPAELEELLKGNPKLQDWVRAVFEKYPDHEEVKWGPKMQVAQRIMHECRLRKEKILFFSHSLETLTFTQELLNERNIKYMRLDGQVDNKNRQRILSDFGKIDEITVLLISTRAGGQGVNLCAANRAIIFDFEWNPVHEEQAVGRIYRLGQEKHVYVYRLVSMDAFDHVVFSKHIKKLSLAQEALDRKNLRKSLAKDSKKYFQLDLLHKRLSRNLEGVELGSEFKEDSLLVNVADRVRSTGAILSVEGYDTFFSELDKSEIDDGLKKHAREYAVRQRSSWKKGRAFQVEYPPQLTVEIVVPMVAQPFNQVTMPVSPAPTGAPVVGLPPQIPSSPTTVSEASTSTSASPQPLSSKPAALVPPAKPVAPDAASFDGKAASVTVPPPPAPQPSSATAAVMEPRPLQPPTAFWTTKDFFTRLPGTAPHAALAASITRSAPSLAPTAPQTQPSTVSSNTAVTAKKASSEVAAPAVPAVQQLTAPSAGAGITAPAVLAEKATTAPILPKPQTTPPTVEGKTGLQTVGIHQPAPPTSQTTAPSSSLGTSGLAAAASVASASHELPPTTFAPTINTAVGTQASAPGPPPVAASTSAAAVGLAAVRSNKAPSPKKSFDIVASLVLPPNAPTPKTPPTPQLASDASIAATVNRPATPPIPSDVLPHHTPQTPPVPPADLAAPDVETVIQQAAVTVFPADGPLPAAVVRDPSPAEEPAALSARIAATPPAPTPKPSTPSPITQSSPIVGTAVPSSWSASPAAVGPSSAQRSVPPARMTKVTLIELLSDSDDEEQPPSASSRSATADANPPAKTAAPSPSMSPNAHKSPTSFDVRASRHPSRASAPARVGSPVPIHPSLRTSAAFNATAAPSTSTDTRPRFGSGPPASTPVETVIDDEITIVETVRRPGSDAGDKSVPSRPPSRTDRDNAASDPSCSIM
ncbi:hypothetical protein RI367_001969 [Sorochytrium milnesiophthora]